MSLCDPLLGRANVVFANLETKQNCYFSGQMGRVTFGSNEYQWHQEGTGGHADPDGPASKSNVKGGVETLYQLPKASITVLRGLIAAQ